MGTIATQKFSRDSSQRQPVRADRKFVAKTRSLSTVSPGLTLLQRQPGCACGGGCPRCQEQALLQTKLKISEPGDKYEQEADRIADEVMRMPDPTIQRQVESEEELQRQPMEEEEEEKEKTLQTKPLAAQITPLVQRQAEPIEEEEETLQTKTTSGQLPNVSSSLQNRITGLQGGGQPLPHSERAFFEPRFGTDFSQVRVHTDSQAAETARAVNARAFTLGQHIVFGARQYQPSASEGRRLLAHELVHFVQQSGNVSFVQCMSYGSGSPPHSDYSVVPTAPARERERVDRAIGLIKKVVDNPKQYPNCHKFFQKNCPAGTATTLKNKFDQATIWFDKDDTVWGSGVSPDHIAYTSETWRWGEWTLAGVFIHEMMHRCGQHNETKNDLAIVACGFPDINKHKRVVTK